MNIFDILSTLLVKILGKQTVRTFENSPWLSIILGNADGEDEDVVSVDQLRNISVGLDWKRLVRSLEMGDEVVDNIHLNKEYPTLN